MGVSSFFNRFTGKATQAAVDETGKVSIEVDEPVDSATGAIKIIRYSHHEIHEGDAYVIRDAKDTAVGDYIDVQITTPDTAEWLHMTFEFEVEKETEFWVYQNVTINATDSAITPGNRNLNSANTSGATFGLCENTSEANANTDTAVAGATLLAHGSMGAGKKTGGTSHSEEEVVLKQNEDYTVRFNAVEAGWINYKLDWYEHQDE